MFVWFLVIFLFGLNVLMLSNRIKEEKVDLLCILIAAISMISIVELVAGLLNIFGYMISSGTCVAVYCITAIGMLWGKRRNEKINISISRYEKIFIFIVTIVFGLTCYYMFGINLKWTYYNSDPAVHFMNAMGIYREKKLNGMYYASLLNCGIIDFFSHFIDEVKFYKAYIFSDICLNYIECIFFGVCMYTQVKSKRGKVLFPIAYVLFIMGYPMYSFVIGGYNYWGLGAILCVYVIYWLKRYENEKHNRGWILFFISLGCFSVSICYMMFVPFIYVTVFVILLETYIKENINFKIAEYVILNLKVFLVPTILTIYYCFFVFFKGNVSTILNVVNIDAATFDLLDTFLFLIPLLAMYIINKRKNKDINTYDISTMVLIGNYILFFILGISGIISPYYYNKLSYPLWCLIWIMLCEFFNSIDYEAMICYLYVVFVSFSSICLLEEKMQDIDEGFIIKNEIDMYSDNMNVLLNRDWSNNYLSYYKKELYSNIINEYDARVVMLADVSQTYNVYFYEAITGEQSAQYCWYCKDDEESFEKVKKDGIEYIVVLKESEFFGRNQEKLGTFDIVKENEAGCIYYIR